MRKALLIDDLAQSPFGAIKVIVNPEVRSELAVPMIADGELVGVLNLECTRPYAFAWASVRSIWMAATSAAVAFKMARAGSTTRRLLRICETATKDPEGSKGALQEIAGVMCETLHADSCDIWHYNSFFDRFDFAGATYQSFVPAARKNGWTNYVWRTGKPVWLYSVQSASEFRQSHWNSGTGWDAVSETPEWIPREINQKVLEERVDAELGMPITVSGNCVGVAWIKFRRNADARVAAPPSNARMTEAFSVASQAGLVLEVVQRQVEGADRRQLESIAEKLRPFSTSSELDFGELPLEGYVIHRTFHKFACGDFHALRVIDKSVVGLLIGDGEGKAVTGLLNALPLITAFEVFGKSSGSTRHVIDRLREISGRLRLASTVLYLTFTLIREMCGCP